VYLIAGVENSNSSVVFWFPSATFLKYWGYNGISPFIGMRFSLYILFKNCSNLSLNPSGAYLYSSQLMLSCPGDLPFFVNFNTFSSSSKVIKAYK